MSLTSLKREFNNVWNDADYQEKKKIQRKLISFLNKKEAERKRIETFLTAVQDDNIKVVKKELNRGIDVNEKGIELGNTALIYALTTNNYDLIKLLLKNGADPHIKNERGYSALDIARMMKKEIFQLIKKNYKE